jgi:hypothetical protein
MLIPTALEDGLLEDWLVEPGGRFPASPAESGQRFARAVAAWFTTATAGAFPCATALARQGQLATQAAGALMAGAPPAVGSQLATALASYMAGQVFGAGTAAMPAASGAVAPAFAAVFSNLAMERDDRARLIALGCYTLALSTVVVFPPPLPPLPVF